MEEKAVSVAVRSVCAKRYDGDEGQDSVEKAQQKESHSEQRLNVRAGISHTKPIC